MNKLSTTDISRGIRKSGLSLQKASPTLLIIGGAVIGVLAIIDYCKKSITQAAPIIEEANQEINALQEKTEEWISEEVASPEDVAALKKECEHEIATIKKDTALKMIGVYARPVALTIVCAIMIGKSHSILRSRNLALAAAFTAVDNGFKMYRKRVVDRFGEEVDRELRYNIERRKIEEKVVDPETGEETVQEKEVKIVNPNPDDPNMYSIYARFFDESCAEWTKNPEYNLAFLKARQEEANMLLKKHGYLFLNTVYDMLGIPRSKAGQVVGWVYSKDNLLGDNYVDFGIYNINRSASRDFVNGYESVILLDFNVDGEIISCLP